MTGEIRIVSEWDTRAAVYKVGETNVESVRCIRTLSRDEFEARVQEILPPGTPVIIEYDNETVELPSLTDPSPL